MGWWGAGVKEDNEGPQLGPFRVGSLAILLFDVLSEILTSCEAVCFFFLPEARLGCGFGGASGRRRPWAIGEDKEGVVSGWAEVSAEE